MRRRRTRSRTDTTIDASWLLAIDFGTTRSCACLATRASVHPVRVDGESRVSSAILLDEDGTIVVGTAALHQGASRPDRFDRTPKVAVGRSTILLGGTPVSVPEAVAAVLRVFGNEASRQRNGSRPALTVLTHPASWSEERLDVMRHAAAIADLASTAFVSEPVAAISAFLDELPPRGTRLAVYDLGGGTFDTAVLEVTDRGPQVIAQGGRPDIGGEVFDHRLFEHVGTHVATTHPSEWALIATSDERRWRRVALDLLGQAQTAKELLSTQTRATIYVPEVDRDILIPRGEFEALVAEDVRATIDELEETIERAGIEIPDLAGIYVTGGSSRIPLVGQTLRERFGDRLVTWDDPKLAVALGAARAVARTLGEPPPPIDYRTLTPTPPAQPDQYTRTPTPSPSQTTTPAPAPAPDYRTQTPTPAPAPAPDYRTQTPTPAPQPARPLPTNSGLGIASMVLGIVGILFCYVGFIPGIVAIVLGRRSMQEIDASAGYKTGRGMAVAGVVMGAVAQLQLVLTITVIVVEVFNVGSSSDPSVRLD